jgi:predicted nucleic acid-binding protein
MRDLFDTDVVLDLIMARVPFASAAGELFDLTEPGIFEAPISALTPLNVFYTARKAKSSIDLREAIKQLVQRIRVCPLDDSVIIAAFALPFADYEDAVQHCCATANGLDAIVTRNIKDYKNASLPIFTPTEFLNHIKSQQS